MSKRFFYLRFNQVRQRRPRIFLCLMYGTVMLILLVPTLALPVRQIIFLSQQIEVRNIEPDNGRLEKMVFTNHEYSRLDFTRGEREFLYRGNMYDVYSIARNGGQVTVLAVWDKPESMLLMALSTGDSSGGLTATGTATMTFLPYFFTEAKSLAEPPAGIRLPGYAPYLFAIPDSSRQICSPPPEKEG